MVKCTENEIKDAVCMLQHNGPPKPTERFNFCPHVNSECHPWTTALVRNDFPACRWYAFSSDYFSHLLFQQGSCFHHWHVKASLLTFRADLPIPDQCERHNTPSFTHFHQQNLPAQRTTNNKWVGLETSLKCEQTRNAHLASFQSEVSGNRIPLLNTRKLWLLQFAVEFCQGNYSENSKR